LKIIAIGFEGGGGKRKGIWIADSRDWRNLGIEWKSDLGSCECDSEAQVPRKSSSHMAESAEPMLIVSRLVFSLVRL
jgi:hypothetical protein